MSILQLITKYIQTRDEANYRQLVGKLPLESMNEEKLSDLATFIMAKVAEITDAYEDKNKGSLFAIRILLDKVDEPILEYGDYPEGMIPFFLKFFFKENTPVSHLKLLLFAYKEYALIELYEYLLRADLSQNIIVALQNLYSVSGGNLPREQFMSLRERARELGNKYYIEFIELKTAEFSDYAEIPEWVKDYGIIKIEEEEEQKEYVSDMEKRLLDIATYGMAQERDERNLPDYSDVERYINRFLKNNQLVPVTDSEQIIQIVIKTLSDSEFDIANLEELKQELRLKISQMSPEALSEFIYPTLLNAHRESLRDNLDLFRLAGPANPKVNTPLIRSSICDKLGGCRMLTCNCEVITDAFTGVQEEEDEVDWYIGHCKNCLLKIRTRAHAVRKPQKFGSWAGCFCSRKCRTEWFAINPCQQKCGTADASDKAEVEACTTVCQVRNDDNETVSNIIVEEYDKLIDKYGIQDRQKE